MSKDIFAQFLTDRLRLVKPDGMIHDNIPSSVSPKGISIQDVSLPIAVGDHLIRKLPSGLEDDFVVDDPGFSPSFHGIPATYQVRYHRADRPSQAPNVVSYKVTGPNARINVQSQDHSTNVAHFQTPGVFEDLRKVIEENVTVATDRLTLLTGLEAMRQNHGQAGFLSKYQSFITTAAKHMTIVAPFLPALSQLLGK